MVKQIENKDIHLVKCKISVKNFKNKYYSFETLKNGQIYTMTVQKRCRERNINENGV